MDLLNDKNSIDSVSKPEIEKVEVAKQEYYLLGSFIRTRGLKLFGYNFLKNFIFEVPVPQGDTIHVEFLGKGRYQLIDYEAEKVTVDSRFEYFEALCLRTASKRVENYKNGKVKQLCNLRKHDPDSIRLF